MVSFVRVYLPGVFSYASLSVSSASHSGRRKISGDVTSGIGYSSAELFCLFLCVQISAARAQAQTERTRTEGEERRKTIDHQQEQERLTAQYKAKLEA